MVGIKGQSVVAQTKTSRISTVFPYTDEEVEDPTWRRTFLPMRLGYAATLQKLQGATLDHATIWLDVGTSSKQPATRLYRASAKTQTGASWGI